MKTVQEVSNLTKVSVRTLHYYDSIGLLSPTTVTEAGYRLYDDTALERLQYILLFRELGFPLKEIKTILNSSDFDRNRALEQQIELLTLKKEHLENLINFARGIKAIGVRYMEFSAFDTSKIDEYAMQAKATYGNTTYYKEYEEKTKDKTTEEMQGLSDDMMQLFVEFGQMKDEEVASERAQGQVKKLRDFINTNFYTCTDEILKALGKMYSGGGSITENIDNAGGKGTAEFVAEAIDIFCKRELNE